MNSLYLAAAILAAVAVPTGEDLAQALVEPAAPIVAPERPGVDVDAEDFARLAILDRVAETVRDAVRLVRRIVYTLLGLGAANLAVGLRLLWLWKRAQGGDEFSGGASPRAPGAAGDSQKRKRK